MVITGARLQEPMQATRSIVNCPRWIRIGTVGHAQAAPQFVAHFDRAGDVAGRAFADPDDVLADGTLPELAVEGGDAGDLRRRDLGWSAQTRRRAASGR